MGIENLNENTNARKTAGKKIITLILIVFLITLLSSVSFYIGNRVACDGGHSQGLTCVDPVDVGVCDFQGTKLIVETLGCEVDLAENAAD